MTLRSRLARLVKDFTTAQSGTVALLTGLGAVPMVLAAGVGLDLIRYSNLKSDIQGALDAASLAAAVADNATTAERKQIGEDTFAVNMVNSGLDATAFHVSFTVTPDSVAGTVDTAIPTTLMRIANINTLKVSADNAVNIPKGKKAEIALVLDYSNSMNETAGSKVKYVAMREAATKLVNDLSTAQPDKVKFGLVPFSHHVYVSLPGEYVVGQTAGSSWTGCTQDRPYPANISDNTPTASDDTKWGQPQAPDHLSEGCAPYAGHGLKLRPLTNDFAGVRNQLNAMTPYAWTHIALGVEFGYHLLSPNAPFVGGAAYNDEDTRKYMVVLTDGMQTEPAFGPGGVRTVSQGEDNLEKLCSKAKASGITIITLAYDLADTTTRKRLENCASDAAKNFFVVDDDKDIAAAFDEIKNAVMASIYLSK
jgi:Flp pilus assembly protein TadG